MDGSGGSTMPLRRNTAVMISYLTPMVVATGAQDQFAPLRKIFENLKNATRSAFLCWHTRNSKPGPHTNRA